MSTTKRYWDLSGMRIRLVYLAPASPRSGAVLASGTRPCDAPAWRAPARVDRLNVRRTVDALLSSRPPGLARSAQGADPRARSAHRRSAPSSVGPARLALFAR